MKTKSPKVSYKEKIQDKVNRLWRSWRKRYDYPDHFEYFVPHRIYDLVLSEARKARNEERYRWLNQPHNEHDKAVQSDTLKRFQELREQRTDKMFGTFDHKGFGEDVLSLIKRMESEV